MASIVNRSPYTVTVSGRGRGKSLTRTFPYDKLKQAEAYMKALIEQGLSPDIAQGSDSFQAAYFSDRGRPIQADRGRQSCVAVGSAGRRAGTGLNVAQSSTISLKPAAVVRMSGVVSSPT